MTSPFARRATYRLTLGEHAWLLGPRTYVMGVLNCTPDSFYDGGRHTTPAAIGAHYERLVAEGADCVDVGGASSRPGAPEVEAAEEWRRIAPACEAARRAGHPVPLAVDTTRYEVAARACDCGATLINDVSALRFEPRLADLASRFNAALVLVHMQGTPGTMQRAPHYDEVVSDIRAALAAAIEIATARGVPRAQILIDPGIGFGKTTAHNLELLNRLPEFSLLECPILIGCSRKKFIGTLLDLPVEERLNGTLGAHAAAVAGGAHVVRVHDVAAHVQLVRLLDAVRAAGAGRPA